MDALGPFVSFCAILAALCVGLCIARLVMPSRLPFLSPQSFPELERRGKLEQDVLWDFLVNADRRNVPHSLFHDSRQVA